MRIPVHVVTGFLGAGKTTLLMDQLARRQGVERCAVVVNDFGVARIDATLLGGAVSVQEIPGGCMCCTAPEALVPALEAILKSQAPDRVFIEPTGLARPADIVDTLRRSALAPQLELAPVVVVIDPARVGDSPPPLLLEQLDAADIAVLRAGVPVAPILQAAMDQHYPPLLAQVQAEQGVVPLEIFELRRATALPFGAIRAGRGHIHGPDCEHPPSTEGWSAASRVWPVSQVFDAARLRATLRACGAERVKGLFHTDLGWFRVDRAGGQVQLIASGQRSGSAVDLIAEGSQDSLSALLDAIEACFWVPEAASEEPELRLREPSGLEHRLNRLALAALPGQVPDVSALVPGREGRAVPLQELLALVDVPADARFVLVASDGLTSAPTPVSQMGDALLVHSLNGEALPKGQGGPFRVLVPKGSSACANVKGLAQLVLLAPQD